MTAQDFYTKLAIVDALGMIGDIRAVSPILKKEIWFEQASRHIGLSKSSVADALSMEITKIMAALVNICKNDIEPLLTYALKDRSVRAADVLEELGWQPSRDENGAIYYLLLSKWDKCVEIGEPAINPLIAKLTGNDHDSRKKAADTLVKIGPSAVGAAIEALKVVLRDDIPLGQERAIELLGRIGDARAIEPLIGALRDDNDDVREEAANVLDELGWQPGQDNIGAAYWVAKREWDKCIEIGTTAVEPLIAVLNSEFTDQKSKAKAAKVLARIGDTRAIEPLIAIISTSRKGLNMVNLVPTTETKTNVQAQHQDYPNNPI